jgi:putative SOS response-associated peptidase YedK
MCGRLEQDLDVSELVRSIPWLSPGAGFQPNLDLRPSQALVAVTSDAGALEPLRWGLIPGWVRDLKDATKPINARCETAHQLATFRDAFKSRRAVIFTTGFYEWRAVGATQKVPVLFELPGRAPMCLAGLWETWTSPTSGEVLRTGAVLTCEPNATVSPVHDRMPVILRPDQVKAWLGAGGDLARSQALMRPYAGELVTRDGGPVLASVKPAKAAPAAPLQFDLFGRTG